MYRGIYYLNLHSDADGQVQNFKSAKSSQMSNFPVWKFRRVHAIQAILRATADRKSWKSRYVPTLLIVHHDPRLP